MQRRSRNNHEDAADRDGGCEIWTGSTGSEGLLNFAGGVVVRRRVAAGPFENFRSEGRPLSNSISLGRSVWWSELRTKALDPGKVNRKLQAGRGVDRDGIGMRGAVRALREN